MTADALTIDALERWALFGATWRVIDITAEQATVELCTCMGEPVQRHECSDPKMIDYLRTANPPGA